MSILGQVNVLQHVSLVTVSFLYSVSPVDPHLYFVPHEVILERNRRRNGFIAQRIQGWDSSARTGRLKLLASEGVCQTQDASPVSGPPSWAWGFWPCLNER